MFETEVPGKWVLTGEHSVLRGVSAVALPSPQFSLQLRFEPGPRLQVRSESCNDSFGLMVENWIADIFADHGVPLDKVPKGLISLKSSIPFGAGLGSSAALCVAITRWMAPYLGLTTDGVQRFATSLEDRFHGKSSGMDVAVCTHAKPMIYSRANGVVLLDVKELPRVTFHDTGDRSATRAAIETVRACIEKNPENGHKIDEKMSRASAIAMEALPAHDLQGIAEAMSLSTECFKAWGLLPPSSERLMGELKTQGALATKVTGAGLGGFVVALWPN